MGNLIRFSIKRKNGTEGITWAKNKTEAKAKAERYGPVASVAVSKTSMIEDYNRLLGGKRK